MIFFLTLLHLGLLFTPFTALTGWLLFVLPGTFIFRTFFVTNGEKLTIWERRAFIVLVSVLFPILSTALGVRLTQSGLTIESARTGYTVLLSMLALVALVVELYRARWQFKPVLAIRWPRQALPQWAVASFLIGLVFLALHMALYRFLPEADGYGWGVILRHLDDTGKVPHGVTRTQFLAIAQTVRAVTDSTIFWLFKAVFPILAWLMAWIVGCALVEKAKLAAWVKALGTLLVLSVPVLCMEMLVGRPQSLALLVFSATLLLLASLQRTRSVDLFVLLTACLGLSFRVHEIISLLVPAVVVTATVTFWSDVRRSPRRTLLYVGVFALLAVAALSPTSAGEYVRASWQQMKDGFAAGPIRWWYIGTYVNTDGIEIGWPGWQAVWFYAYTLGFTLPALGLAWWLSAKKKLGGGYSLLPFVVQAALLALFAELFPRFGYANLPDRAWIFLSYTLLLLLISRAGLLTAQRIPRAAVIVGALAIFSSFAGGVYVTYAKQGRVSEKEYAAVPRIQAVIPQNALVVSQSLNDPIVRFFANRKMIALPSYFGAADSEDRAQVMGDFVTGLEQSEEIFLAKGIALQQEARRRLRQPIKTVEELESVQAALNAIIARLKLELVNNEDLVHPYEGVYILYSTDKLHGLSAERAWWRAEAFPDFPVTEIGAEPYAEEVYSDGTIWIWRVK